MMARVRCGGLSRWLSRSLAMLAATTSLLALAGTAQAAISQTAITSPSDPAYFYDPTGGATDNSSNAIAGFTVTGTTNSTDPASDTVDIDCYSDDGSTGIDEGTLVSNVGLNSSGGFSTTVRYGDMENTGSTASCRLRAVPAGTQPTAGLASFAGPRVLLAYMATRWDYYNGGEAIETYGLYAPQLGAANMYQPLSGYGLQYSFLFDPSVFGQYAGNEAFGDSGFNGDDYVNDYSGDIEVDGSTAYLADFTAGYDGPGQGGLTFSATQNPSNGDMTIKEADPISLYDYTSNSYVSSGVEDQRTITQTDNGHIVYIDDRYSSTDGQAHTVTLYLQNDQDFSGAGTDDFAIPGQSGYSTYSSGSTVTVAPAPASIYVQAPGVPDGSTAAAQGAITYFTTPSDVLWFTTATNFQLPYMLTVPAGGSVNLDFAYSTEFSQAALAQDTQTALDLHSPPAVTIDAPAAGATLSAASVTVTGTASAGSGVKSVTINGVAATLSGSSYSATVPLSVGANKLIATVTSDAGGTASASESVSYSPPGGPSTVTTAPSTVITAAAKVLPRQLTLKVKPRRAGGPPYRFTASGRLVLPTGVSAADGCSGTVTLRFKHAGKTVLVRYARVTASCHYSSSYSFSKRKLSGAGKVRVSAGFGGNAALKPRAARAVTVRYASGATAGAADANANVEAGR